MGELIKKINWNSIDDPAQFESWLSEQAKKGLLFRHMKGIHIWFEQTEPYEMEYRIVHSKMNLSEEQKCRYNQLGWKVIFNSGDTFILAGVKEDDPSELYFGEKEERDFQTVGKGTFIFWCLLNVFWAAFAIEALFSFNGGIHLNWTRINSSRFELYNPVIFICLGFLNGIIPYNVQRNYIKRVKEKGREAHHIAWKGAAIRRNTIFAILILMMIYLFVGAGFDFLTR